MKYWFCIVLVVWILVLWSVVVVVIFMNESLFEVDVVIILVVDGLGEELIVMIFEEEFFIVECGGILMIFIGICLLIVLIIFLECLWCLFF